MKGSLRVLLAVLLLAGLVLGAGGCPAGTTAPETGAPAATETAPSPIEGPHSGTLNLYGADPWTLDPAISGEMRSHEYIFQIFSGLLCLGDDLLPEGDIARDWTVSEDGTVYTFRLRDDVRFHDGRAVTAADFKYSWERACAPATGSQTAAIYLNDILGASEVLSGRRPDLAGVKVIDSLTLEVTVDAPKTYFLAKLTYPTAFVVDEDNAGQGGDWWRRPNGTGPFKLKEWQRGEALVLKRNADFHGRRAGVDEVRYQFLSGNSINLYETGEIDVCGVSSGYIDKAGDPDGPFAGQLAVAPELSLYYLGFNTRVPPFDNPDMRRAFAMAVDKDKIAHLIYRDMVVPADGILPPGMPGFNPGLTPLEYDPAAARDIIVARYGSVAAMPAVTFTVSGSGGLVSRQTQALVTGWREALGVEVKVRQVETERFFYHTEEEIDNMYAIGWVADYPHPQDFLDVLFGSGSASNNSGYVNAAVDGLLARASVEPDYDTMVSLYRQAEQLLVDDAACVPLSFGQNYMLVQPYVNGYSLNGQGLPRLNRVTLEGD